MKEWFSREANRNLAVVVIFSLGWALYLFWQNSVVLNERIQAECQERENACREELRQATQLYIQELVRVQMLALDIKQRADSTVQAVTNKPNKKRTK